MRYNNWCYNITSEEKIMKNKKIILSFLVITTMAKGASIDHIMNYTPEYNANPALQGAINSTSTVNYNPAGLMRLENGLYFNGGLQLGIGKYKVGYSGKDHSTDLLSATGSFSVFKKYDKYALYLTFGGLAGGAAVDYKSGISTYTMMENTLNGQFPGSRINFSSATGENRYLQTTIGAAFNITPKLSGSIAGRVVRGKRDFTGKVEGSIPVFPAPFPKLPIRAEIDAEREAYGFGIQLGLNYLVTEKLNVGLRYDSKVKLNFKTDSSSVSSLGKKPIAGNNLFGQFYPEYINGSKYRRDLPALLALGAQYKVTDSWNLYSGVTYYFNKSANIDEAVKEKVKIGEGASRVYNDGYEIAIGSELQISEKISWLAGMNYSVTGASPENYHDSEYALDSIMLGTGIKYTATQKLTLIGSVSHYFYLPESSSGHDYKKRMTAVGVGITYKL